jgi:serine protease Do
MGGMEGRSFLGVGVQEVTSERAKALKLKDEYGVEITSVQDDSPASKAGLKVGDIVLDYNGQRVEGTEQFIRMVRETPVGRTVKMQVGRGGATQTVSATVAARKAAQVFTMSPGGPMKIEIPDIHVTIPDIPKATMSWRSPMLGVDAESLGESQLAAYFGVKEGVLVRSVNKGSAAEKAGIKAGDVILKVDETNVTSPRDISSALRSSREGSKKNVPVQLMRDRKETTLTVTLDEEPARSAPRSRGVVRQMDL